MGLKTPEQYQSSLRDGRTVFYRGEKVPDVNAHPVIGLAVRHASLDYRMAEDPKYRELAVVKEGGDEYSRYYLIPRNADDLRKRSDLSRLQVVAIAPTLARDGGCGGDAHAELSHWR